MVPGLANGKIDLAWTVEPFLSMGTARGISQLLVGDGEIIAGDQPAVLGLSGVFAKQQPEAAQRFVVAWLRGERDAWHASTRRTFRPTRRSRV